MYVNGIEIGVGLGAFGPSGTNPTLGPSIMVLPPGADAAKPDAGRAAPRVVTPKPTPPTAAPQGALPAFSTGGNPNSSLTITPGGTIQIPAAGPPKPAPAAKGSDGSLAAELANSTTKTPAEKAAAAFAQALAAIAQASTTPAGDTPEKRGALLASIQAVHDATAARSYQLQAGAIWKGIVNPRLALAENYIVAAVHTIRAMPILADWVAQVTAPNYAGGAELSLSPDTRKAIAVALQNPALVNDLESLQGRSAEIAKLNLEIAAARKIAVQGKLPMTWRSNVAIYTAQFPMPNGPWISIPATATKEPSAQGLSLAYGGEHNGIKATYAKDFGVTAGNGAPGYNAASNFAWEVHHKDDDWSESYVLGWITTEERATRAKVMPLVSQRGDKVAELAGIVAKICTPNVTQMAGGPVLVEPKTQAPNGWYYTAARLLSLIVVDDSAEKDNFAKIRNMPAAEIKMGAVWPYMGADSTLAKLRQANTDLYVQANSTEENPQNGIVGFTAYAALPADVQAFVDVRAAFFAAGGFANYCGNTVDETIFSPAIDMVNLVGSLVGNTNAGGNKGTLAEKAAQFASEVAALMAKPMPGTLYAALCTAKQTIDGGATAAPDVLAYAYALRAENIWRVKTIMGLQERNNKSIFNRNSEVAASGELLAQAAATLAAAPELTIAVPGGVAPTDKFTVKPTPDASSAASLADALAKLDKYTKDIAKAQQDIAATSTGGIVKVANDTGTPIVGSDTIIADDKKLNEDPPPPPPPPKESNTGLWLAAALVAAKVAFG